MEEFFWTGTNMQRLRITLEAASAYRMHMETLHHWSCLPVQYDNMWAPGLLVHALRRIAMNAIIVNKEGIESSTAAHFFGMARISPTHLSVRTNKTLNNILNQIFEMSLAKRPLWLEKPLSTPLIKWQP